jgi:DNA-binding GntR family transcriptional regulator
MKTSASLSNGTRDSLPEATAAVSLKHRAYAELRNQILSGALPPGELLSERQLALALKMSKTPVHAALERLEAEGLVTVTAQQGIVVRAISAQEIADHFEIREALETFVVARLAGRLTAERIARLRRNLTEHRRGVRQGDIAEHIRLDSEFHLLLCEFLGNGEITRAMSQVRDKIHRVMHHIVTRFPQRMTEALSEHEAVVLALAAGDGPAAAERMTTHLRNGLQSVYHRHP